jgi:hypothetical protein
MSDVISLAKKNKARALELRDMDKPGFDQAHRLLNEAEEALDLALQAEIKDRGGRSPDKFELDLALQLTHIRGSNGGVFRRQGVRAGATPARYHYLLQSISAYDAGYKVEEIYRNKIDSYTLVQRLVARVLLKPTAADEECVVENQAVRRGLDRAAGLIQEQTRTGGVREKDEYAFADLSMVLFLLGRSEWKEKVGNLKSMPNADYAINSTREVISDIRAIANDAQDASQRFREELDAALKMFSG